MAQSPERVTKLRAGAEGRAVHDVGGLDFGPIDRADHDPELWEKRVDAILNLLIGAKKGAFKVDAMRRVIEDYGQQQYDATTYYEKWVRAICALIVEQEIVTRAEIDAKLVELKARVENSGRAVSPVVIPWNTP